MKRRDFLRLAACAPLLSVGTLLPRTAAARPTAVDGIYFFGELPAPDRIRKVFVTGRPASVLVHTLVPHKQMGWPGEMSGEALALLAPQYRTLPALGQLSGRGSTVPMERLLALAPDVIVDAGMVSEHILSLAERVHQQTGIPYILVNGRLRDSASQLRHTGRLLGAGERAETLARHAETVLTACPPAATQGKPKVYMARANDGLETPLPGSVNGEIIEAACAVNAASSNDTRSGNLARVSLEQLLAWKPDFIVTQFTEFAALARRDPTWNSLPAVREGRLFLAPSQPFGWLDVPPSVNRLIGVRWLREVLRNGGPTTDWIDEAEEFHRLFYGHVPPRELLVRAITPA
ncbi:ABC transporter substrate-binding protein [Thauera sp.]|uniref:ABC transporter substrate-binding protein n=1 Tax=Thauera sp. TaxID=1905334 RepID=UPI0039E5C522